MRLRAALLVLALAGLPARAQEDAAAPPPDGEPVETIPVAEPATPPPARESGTTQLDEMIVTAQRRAESLQETPISIEAFNADALEQRGIQGLQDLSLQAPGLTIEPFPTHNATLRLFIRGVGINDAQLTQDPAVGVYVDGVYIGRSVGLALDVADLQRIEVLRGPQGTLYGRNTTGGAINLITKRPTTGVFDMAHSLSFASRELITGKSSFNVPLGDHAAFKLAALRSGRHGFVRNTGPGGDFGDRSETALRLDGRWVPWYWLTADYAHERTDMDYFNYMFQAQRRPLTSHGQGDLFKSYAETQTVYSDRRLSHLATTAPLERSGTRIRGHSLTLTAPIADYEVKYIGAIRDLRDAEYADLGGGLGSPDYRLDSHAYDGPAADLANGGPTPLVIPTVTQDQTSHELQLLGKLLDGRVDFVAGAYRFHETATEDRHRLNHQVSTVIPPDQVDELNAAIPEFGTVLDELGIVDFNQIDNLRLVNFVDLNWDIENTASAFFGQATWMPPVLDDRLRLTFGYRHSDDDRRAVKFRVSDSYVEVRNDGQDRARLLQSAERFDNVPAHRRFSDDSITWIAAWDLTGSVNVYLKSAEAYKSGGFNVRDPHINAQSGSATPSPSDDNTYGFGFVDGFAPEHVHSWELGARTEWLDRRLRANASVFDSDYEDMQINFLIPGTISDTKTENAGRARMRGLELDLTWLALDALRLSLDYAWLDAKVQDVRNAQGENVAHLFPFTSAPEHSGVLAADWTFLKRGWGDLRANLAWQYVTRREGIVIVEERRGMTSIPAYGLWQGRVTLGGVRTGGHGVLDVALWGKNLADKVYPVMAIDNTPQADRSVVWGEPRTLGLDFIYRYQ